MFKQCWAKFNVDVRWSLSFQLKQNDAAQRRACKWTHSDCYTALIQWLYSGLHTVECLQFPVLQFVPASVCVSVCVCVFINLYQTVRLPRVAGHIHKANRQCLIRATAPRQHYSHLAQPPSVFLPLSHFLLHPLFTSALHTSHLTGTTLSSRLLRRHA